MTPQIVNLIFKQCNHELPGDQIFLADSRVAAQLLKTQVRRQYRFISFSSLSPARMDISTPDLHMKANI